MANERVRILFLCTGNSCRSQMAEGWARQLWPEHYEAFSAGLEARGLDHQAVAVMAEAGVDIGQQRSRSLGELDETDFDVVVTVCDHAHEHCPHYPRETLLLHRSFDDPPRLALAARDEKEALAPYRRVRDEIREFVMGLPALIETGH